MNFEVLVRSVKESDVRFSFFFFLTLTPFFIKSIETEVLCTSEIS